MITQKLIIEVITKNTLATPNASDSMRIIDEFNRLDHSKNYCWVFQKSQDYWTAANWKVVARDIQAAIAKL